MHKRSAIKNITHEKRLFKSRLIILSIFAALLTLGLIIRLINLQLMHYQRYQTLSKKNHLDLVPIIPRRGLIFDRHGELIAENIPVFSLMITPSNVRDLKKLLSDLASRVMLSESDVELFYRELNNHRPFDAIPLKLQLSDEEVAKISIDRYRFPAVNIEARLIRHYPFRTTLSHVLGYMGRINTKELSTLDISNYTGTNFIGKLGIEKFYENLLHGTVGYQQVEIDAHGARIRELDSILPVSGSDIYLTIDSKLQSAAEEALSGNKGAVVAIDPNNGEVLALVSEPTYDPNLFVQGISQSEYQKLRKDKSFPLYNRTIRGLYAPGSPVKPFIALQGLETGAITPTYRIFDPGFYKLPTAEHIYHDWQKMGHGWVDISKAIAESCDTYFYNLGHRMGIRKIADILFRFGFGAKTEIDMGEEIAGTVPTPEWKEKHVGERWYEGDTVISSIGQGFMQATPLQLAAGAAAIAMKGKRFKPHLLAAIGSPKKEKQNILPEALNSVVLKNSENWDLVIKAMQRVITEGTAVRFGKTPYTVAGKTGTAQLLSGQKAAHLKSSDLPTYLRDNSVFIAFAPVENPKIAIAVLVENSTVPAMTVARKVLDYYLLSEQKSEEGKHAI